MVVTASGSPFDSDPKNQVHFDNGIDFDRQYVLERLASLLGVGHSRLITNLRIFNPRTEVDDVW